jgi:hypothetical protein
MTPQYKWAPEAYWQWRGIEPPMPRDEVERRVRETLAVGKDGDFAVLKNLHVVIKNGRPAWFFKFTPKPVSAPLSAIPISKPEERPKERPIKKKLGNFSEVRTCKSTRNITYDIAIQQTERLRDFLKNVRQSMPEIDERKIFGLWSRGLQSDVSSLNLREQKYLEMLVNIAGWLPAPATGPSEDEAYFNDDYEVETPGDETDAFHDPYKVDDDEVETSGDETGAVQPKVQDYEIIDEHNINRSYFTDGEPSSDEGKAGG